MTDTFNLVRIEIDDGALLEWSRDRGMLRRGRIHDEGFALHCLLREVFGDLRPQPFKYNRSQGRGGHRGPMAQKATLFGYTGADAEQLSESMKRFADPLQVAALHRIQTKEMPDNFYEGDRLGFEVTVRPIRRIDNEQGRRIEVDAFLADEDQTRNRAEVYVDWLTRRMEFNGSVIVENMRMEYCSLQPAVRRLGGKPSVGPHALMRGVLRVGSEEGFLKMLRAGVGRHKSYGYGMLFLRPAVV